MIESIREGHSLYNIVLFIYIYIYIYIYINVESRKLSLDLI